MSMVCDVFWGHMICMFVHLSFPSTPGFYSKCVMLNWVVDVIRAQGAGIAQWLEHRTRDWKVAGSNPCWNGGRIFFSRVDFLCWLLFRYPFHPRVTTVARKKSRSFCQKCRWQVTAKHAYTLRMWILLNRASALVTTCPLICQMTSEDIKHQFIIIRAQEQCESGGGCPGLPSPNKPDWFCGCKATVKYVLTDQSSVDHSSWPALGRTDYVSMVKVYIIKPNLVLGSFLHSHGEEKKKTRKKEEKKVYVMDQC